MVVGEVQTEAEAVVAGLYSATPVSLQRERLARASGVAWRPMRRAVMAQQAVGYAGDVVEEDPQRLLDARFFRFGVAFVAI